MGRHARIVTTKSSRVSLSGCHNTSITIEIFYLIRITDRVGCKIFQPMILHVWTLNLVIYHPLSSKFHIWTTFIKLLFMSKYGVCQMNDYQDCHHNRYPSPLHCRALCWALCLSLNVLVVKCISPRGFLIFISHLRPQGWLFFPCSPTFQCLSHIWCIHHSFITYYSV